MVKIYFLKKIILHTSVLSSIFLIGVSNILPLFAQSRVAAWGDLGDGTYRNPVLFADYNNPDVIKVGDDFYMIAASHHFMGNPILHSKDMINWSDDKLNQVIQRFNQGK